MNEQIIWDFLKSMGLSDYAVAGIMGNLYAESGLISKNVQNSSGYTDDEYTDMVNNGSYSESQFVNDSIGYGIAQWTYWSRKQLLYNYLIKNGLQIDNLNGQLRFLYNELEQYGLITALNNATSVREASDIILLEYEKPADQSESVRIQRAEYSQVYYDEYSDGSGGGGGSAQDYSHSLIQWLKFRKR